MLVARLTGDSVFVEGEHGVGLSTGGATDVLEEATSERPRQTTLLLALLQGTGAGATRGEVRADIAIRV